MNIQHLLENTHLYQPIQLKPSFGYCCLWCALQGYDMSQPNKELMTKLSELHGLAVLLDQNDQIEEVWYNKNLRYSLFFGKIICLQIVDQWAEIWDLYQQHLFKQENNKQIWHYVITFYYKQEEGAANCSIAIRKDDFKVSVFDPQSGMYTLIGLHLLQDWTKAFFKTYFEMPDPRKQIYKLRIFKVY